MNSETANSAGLHSTLLSKELAVEAPDFFLQILKECVWLSQGGGLMYLKMFSP
jgi:hypothetical protein